MLLKTTRVALLIVIIPLINFILKKRFFLPWYLLLFVGVGIIYSTNQIPVAIADGVQVVYNLIFATALASIGLNANILEIGKRVWISFAITYVVFLGALAVFLTGEHLFH